MNLRSTPFWIPQWQSDHLQAMNERVTGWNRQADISTILNSTMTIRPLTCYKSESNRLEQTGRDQHHSELPNDNQITYILWIREQQSGTDRQRSAPFWIAQWHSDHLHTMNQRAIGWNRQAEISSILNSPMIIRPRTYYESENNRVEQTGRDQHHSEFHNDNHTTYLL